MQLIHANTAVTAFFFFLKASIQLFELDNSRKQQSPFSIVVVVVVVVVVVAAAAVLWIISWRWYSSNDAIFESGTDSLDLGPSPQQEILGTQAHTQNTQRGVALSTTGVEKSLVSSRGCRYMSFIQNPMCSTYADTYAPVFTGAMYTSIHYSTVHISMAIGTHACICIYII